MSGCTGTDKSEAEKLQSARPLVTIVMATYNPRMDWLKEQLASLESQTYRPLELVVLDDCSSKADLNEIQDCVEDCIKSIPYRIMRNEENLGSNKTFEKLTLLASGEYIAYCDQDDVWHEDKIETCFEELVKASGVMAFSDMIIINGKGEKTADSITKVRRHHKFYSGTGLSRILLFSNFVTGCTTLVKTAKAKEAIPFCPHMVHDHWLALFCSVDERLVFIQKPLIDYRIHESNQTLMMAGVKDKDSYFRIRIDEALKKFLWLKERFQGEAELSQTIEQAIEWMKARSNHFKGLHRSAATIWKYRRFSYWTSLFELMAPIFPEKVFMFIIGLKKKNIV